MEIKDILTTKSRPLLLEPNKSRDEYRRIVGVNSSSLAAGLVGVDDVDPAAVKLAWEAPETTDRSQSSQDALDRGTLAHLMILQPELLMSRVAVWEGGRRFGAEWDGFEDANINKLIVTSKDYARVATGVNQMRSLEPVARLFRGIEAEVVMSGTEPCQLGNGNIAVRGQVDAVNLATKTIVDLKTTSHGISQRAVEHSVRQFHYREKMANYRKWVAAATETDPVGWKCFNVFMSLTPPFGVRVVQFVDYALEWGLYRMQQCLGSVEQCLRSGEWPMYCRESFMAVQTWEEEDSEDVNYG